MTSGTEKRGVAGTAWLEIHDVDLDDDGQILTLRIHVHNGAAVPLFAYASVRRMKYDPASHTLEAVLADRDVTVLSPQTRFLLPHFVAIAPGTDATIEVTVPRVLVTTATQDDQTAPRIDRLAAYEAAVVTVELAWSDRPFDVSRPPGAWTKGYAAFRKVLRGGN